MWNEYYRAQCREKLIVVDQFLLQTVLVKFIYNFRSTLLLRSIHQIIIISL